MGGPGRSYQALHSDAFSAELEALGLDSTIFGAMGIPAPVFQALVPRKAGSFDEHAHTFGTGDEPASFTRASDGIYLDSDGKYKIASSGQIRAEYSSAGVFLGYLFEPAITNKCTSYSDASSLTNLSEAGDPAGVLSIVSDSELADVGLSDLLNGQCFQIDNSGGTGVYSITSAGATGNTNTHTYSVWAKVVTAGAWHTLRDSTTSPSVNFANTTWQRLTVTGAPSAGTGSLQIRVAPGAVIRFVLQQTEELPVVSSPIITQGASASRAADALSWPAGSGSIISNTAGTAMLDFSPAFAETEPPAATGIVHLIALDASYYQIAHSLHPTGNRITCHDGATQTFASIGAAITKDQTIRCAVRWGSSTKSAGFSVAGGAWTFQSGTYDGAWEKSLNMFTLANFDRSTIDYPIRIKNVQVWNRDLGTAEIGRLF